MSPDPVVPPTPPENVPPTPPVVEPPAPPPPEPGAPPAAPPVGLSFSSQDQLNERLDRAKRSELKELFGTDNRDDIKASWKKFQESESAAETQRQADLTENQRLKEEVAGLKGEKAEAELIAETAIFENHVAKLSAERGIRDVDYAMFRITQEAEKLPEGEEFDEVAFLDGEVADATKRAKYGLEGPPRTVEVPATTVPGAPPAPGAPAPGGTGEVKTSMDLTQEEWAKKRQALGL